MAEMEPREMEPRYIMMNIIKYYENNNEKWVKELVEDLYSEAEEHFKKEGKKIPNLRKNLLDTLDRISSVADCYKAAWNHGYKDAYQLALLEGHANQNIGPIRNFYRKSIDYKE